MPALPGHPTLEACGFAGARPALSGRPPSRTAGRTLGLGLAAEFRSQLRSCATRERGRYTSVSLSSFICLGGMVTIPASRGPV